MTFTLAIILAGIVMIALNAYVLLAGADFGGGVWDFFARGDRRQAQRDLISHAIAPIWEANHVWLILVIVLLFTCFPAAFSRMLSASCALTSTARSAASPSRSTRKARISRSASASPIAAQVDYPR